jgi:hypothetical protein
MIVMNKKRENLRKIDRYAVYEFSGPANKYNKRYEVWKMDSKKKAWEWSRYLNSKHNPDMDVSFYDYGALTTLKNRRRPWYFSGDIIGKPKK